MKKILNLSMVSKHFKKYSYNYQGAFGCLICLLLFFLVVATIDYIFESKERIETLEIKVENLEQQTIKQSLKIIKLDDLLDEHEVLFYYYQQQITDNLEGININSKRITTNAIEIDQSSLEGLKTIIEEFEDELDYLRKKVK